VYLRYPVKFLRIHVVRYAEHQKTERTMTHRSRIFLLTAALVMAASAMAAPRGERGTHRGGTEFAQVMQHLGEAIRGLDLTEDQRAAVQAEFEAHRETVRPLAEEMRSSRQALHEVIMADAYDADAAADIAQRQGALAAELMTVSANAAAAVLGQLTDEQRAELDTLIEFRRGHRAEHRAMMKERMKKLRDRRRERGTQEAPPGN
jgi:Spy/CpxP family protein refolding chaperone